MPTIATDARAVATFTLRSAHVLAYRVSDICRVEGVRVGVSAGFSAYLHSSCRPPAGRDSRVSRVSLALRRVGLRGPGFAFAWAAGA